MSCPDWFTCRELVAQHPADLFSNRLMEMAWEISVLLHSFTFPSHRPHSGEISGVSQISLASWGLQLEKPAAGICRIPRLIMFVKGQPWQHAPKGTLPVFQYLLVLLAGLLFFLFMPLPSKALPNYRIYLTTSF